VSVRKRVRQAAFDLARPELANFLDENEEKLLKVFREEIQKLDDSIPEENLFIDIKMVPLGELILKACLKALKRFLREEA
jgi:hypothetical protein